MGADARLRRTWRVVFVLYLAAMTTGTHWPRLRLGPSFPTTDKVAHTVACAGLTVLLWRTGWFRGRLGLALLAALLWTTLDELSQSLPVLQRSASGWDMLANALGIALAGAWIGAMRLTGDDAARRRQRFDRLVVDIVFARWTTWLLLLAIAAGCAAPLLVVWPNLPPERTGGPALLALAAALAAGGGAVRLLYAAERRRRLASADASAPIDDAPSLAAALRRSPDAVALALAGIVGGALVVTTPRPIPGLPLAMHSVVGLSLAASLLALATWRVRHRRWRGGARLAGEHDADD